MELRNNKKVTIKDKEFTAGLLDADFSRKELVRVFAVKQTFTGAAFKQANFLSCYFRNCRFIKCDFTGASFKDSNFRGAQFEECNFKYTTWEKTVIDDDFLANCLPSEGNLARDLVRSLRVNFSQIGNYEAVNIAASIEVKLTGKHLFNAAYSKQSYYRAKYKGWNRFRHALRYIQWKLLDLLWGNGESVFCILRAGLFVVLVAAVLSMCGVSDVTFKTAFCEAFWHFWGAQYKAPMPPVYVIILTVTRFVTFGLFMAILVKRLARR